jgi:beta-N-acetylhexosaminidase
VNVRALARILTGEVDPTGRLPVTIPGHYPFGAGVSFTDDTLQPSEVPTAAR